MPELSRFAGIIIKMLFNDTAQHNKPHVHVYYGEYQASVGIDGELLAGSLPVCEAAEDGRGLAGPARGRSLCRVEQGGSRREL